MDRSSPSLEEQVLNIFAGEDLVRTLHQMHAQSSGVVRLGLEAMELKVRRSPRCTGLSLIMSAHGFPGQRSACEATVLFGAHLRLTDTSYNVLLQVFFHQSKQKFI